MSSSSVPPARLPSDVRHRRAFRNWLVGAAIALFVSSHAIEVSGGDPYAVGHRVGELTVWPVLIGAVAFFGGRALLRRFRG
jgi:hypothetical protein